MKLKTYIVIKGDSKVIVDDRSKAEYLGNGWSLQGAPAAKAKETASELEPKGDALVDLVDDRALPGLAAIGIETIEQFAEASDEQLLGVRYITEKALAKYRKALEG